MLAWRVILLQPWKSSFGQVYSCCKMECFTSKSLFYIFWNISWIWEDILHWNPFSNTNLQSFLVKVKQNETLHVLRRESFYLLIDFKFNRRKDWTAYVCIKEIWLWNEHQPVTNINTSQASAVLVFIKLHIDKHTFMSVESIIGSCS